MSITKGQCLCGQIEIEMDGEPKMQGNCHCTDCKQATGSTYASLVFFPSESVKVTSGELKEFQHTADSGSKMTKMFCPNCGGLMLGKNSAREGFTAVYIGCVVEPKWKVQPAFNVWVSRKLDGTLIDSNIPSFEENKTA